MEQGGFSTAAGLREAFKKCVDFMGDLTSEKLAAKASQGGGIWTSGLVMYARNRAYRAWIAFACLVGLDAYGDRGNAALSAFFLWVFGVPFIIVQVCCARTLLNIFFFHLVLKAPFRPPPIFWALVFGRVA